MTRQIASGLLHIIRNDNPRNDMCRTMLLISLPHPCNKFQKNFLNN
jgi:hypothetical protein